MLVGGLAGCGNGEGNVSLCALSVSLAWVMVARGGCEGVVVVWEGVPQYKVHNRTSHLAIGCDKCNIGERCSGELPVVTWVCLRRASLPFCLSCHTVLSGCSVCH